MTQTDVTLQHVFDRAISLAAAEMATVDVIPEMMDAGLSGEDAKAIKRASATLLAGGSDEQANALLKEAGLSEKKREGLIATIHQGLNL